MQNFAARRKAQKTVERSEQIARIYARLRVGVVLFHVTK